MWTRRWFRSDQTLAQSLVSSFDQGDFIWCDRTLRGERPDAGDSSKVPERENHGRTHPISAKRTLSSVRSQLKHWVSWRTDQSVRSPRRDT